METHEKDRLVLLNESDPYAAGVRLRATRKMLGMTLAELGKCGGVGAAAVSNAEKGMGYIGRKLMIYLAFEQRVDYDFQVTGAYSRLQADVQEKLFSALKDVHEEMARK